MRTLTIIGVGMGAPDLLTPRAKAAAERCDPLYATARAAELFPHALALTWENLLQAVQNGPGENMGALVSGDAGFFSASNALIHAFGDDSSVEIINGVNTLQYFAAKLRTPYENMPVYSVHGREDSGLLGKVSYNRFVFVLTGGPNNAHTVCQKLTCAGLGGVRVYAGENLSYENERILCRRAEEGFQNTELSGLTALIIENEQCTDPSQTLSDEDFTRGSVPMTKAEVRNIAMAKLSVRPEEIVFDIGAGTGSVAVALARKARDGIVYAIERNETALNLMEQNRKKLGAYNLTLIAGSAPEALGGLPAPDSVFIGGSGGHLREIAAAVRAKNPEVKIAVTAVTLETLKEITELPDLAAEMICVNVTQICAVGEYNMMRAQNPVYIAMLRRKRD
ncbi:MAG: precorrin-6y C5,15-methyltransferase (decarboxylating) subunit CbiE [Clostridiales bacterium]|jgi:precorrin-6Y C5,15-methyltransferase (decarboxylating)|nr:precorrin-6y C5,15-methyltransferase (decarboxylating) subunit CbiE [Clostridiales bacterium]